MNITRGCIAEILLLISLATVYAELTPDMQADQYLVAAKRQIDAGNYSAAVDYFKKILALNVKVPDEFFYHYGKTLVATGAYTDGQAAIEKYLTLAGKGGSYYLQALEQLSIISEKQEVQNTLIAKQREEAKRAPYDNAVAVLTSFSVYVSDGAGGVNFIDSISVSDSSKSISIKKIDKENVISNKTGKFGGGIIAQRERYTLTRDASEIYFKDITSITSESNKYDSNSKIIHINGDFIDNSYRLVHSFSVRYDGTYKDQWVKDPNNNSSYFEFTSSNGRMTLIVSNNDAQKIKDAIQTVIKGKPY